MSKSNVDLDDLQIEQYEEHDLFGPLAVNEGLEAEMEELVEEAKQCDDCEIGDLCAEHEPRRERLLQRYKDWERDQIRADTAGMEGMFDDVTANQVAAGAFIIAAGAYGYISAEYGNAAVDTASAQPYPEIAWLFLVFGLALGVGFSALVAGMDGDGDGE